MNCSNKVKLNISVITLPFDDMVGETMLANFIDVLEPLSDKIYVITGNFSYKSNEKIRIIKIKTNKKKSILIKALDFIVTQLRISSNLIKISKNIDIVIFFIGARGYPIPMLFAKLLGKKTVVAATGSASKASKERHKETLFGLGGIIFPAISGFLEHSTFHLADQVAVESESAINFLGLNKYRRKISINGARYIDINSFKIEKELKDKRNLIGYIGRLIPEKGLMDFAKAISLILKRKGNLEFLIGGNGPLFDEIKHELKNNGSYDKVKLTGWVPHDELPNYLNELKLIILPSYTEGLPGIVQEGMACGAVVLATPVGGIPDLINDGETGFILEDNSPECIAENVLRALEHSNLDEIVKNARKLIEDEYSYEVMVRKCKDSLDELMRGKREKSQ